VILGGRETTVGRSHAGSPFGVTALVDGGGLGGEKAGALGVPLAET